MSRSKKISKAVILLASLVLLVTVGVGSTLAYLVTTTDPVKNIFTPSEVTVQVNETFDGNTKTNVSIKNTGDTTAYIRAAVIITWQDEDGNVYGQPVQASDYNITWGTGWIHGSDGFYYWTQPVAPDANTGVLINSCKLNDGVTAPDGYYLNVEIIASGIQSEPDGVVKEAWKVVEVGQNDQLQTVTTQG